MAGLFGTLFGGSSAPEILPVLGASQSDLNQMCALDSQYSSQGRTVTYNGVDVVVIIEDQTTVPTQDEQTYCEEQLTFMVRRYNGVERPVVGDRLVLAEDAGVAEKVFRLSKMPADAFSQLEWELTFSRKRTKSRGGSQQRPL